jgi:hypothetical protein
MHRRPTLSDVRPERPIGVLQNDSQAGQKTTLRPFARLCGHRLFSYSCPLFLTIEPSRSSFFLCVHALSTEFER